MIIQLNPPIPLNVVEGNEWRGPTGPALCHFLIDPGIESDLVWICFMDNTGQCWSVPNRFIRAQKNITASRSNPER